MGELARRVTFPVYQDTETQGLWELLQGGKDDTLIYDRCGQLTRHIPYPDSLLRHRHFQDAMFEAYYHNPCNCVINTSQPVSSHSAQDTPRDSLQRHQPHHSRQHRRRLDQNNRHRQRHRRNAVLSDIVLHRDRMSEILSNRISK